MWSSYYIVVYSSQQKASSSGVIRQITGIGATHRCWIQIHGVLSKHPMVTITMTMVTKVWESQLTVHFQNRGGASQICFWKSKWVEEILLRWFIGVQLVCLFDLLCPYYSCPSLDIAIVALASPSPSPSPSPKREDRWGVLRNGIKQSVSQLAHLKVWSGNET